MDRDSAKKENCCLEKGFAGKGFEKEQTAPEAGERIEERAEK